MSQSRRMKPLYPPRYIDADLEITEPVSQFRFIQPQGKLFVPEFRRSKPFPFFFFSTDKIIGRISFLKEKILVVSGHYNSQLPVLLHNIGWPGVEVPVILSAFLFKKAIVILGDNFYQPFSGLLVLQVAVKCHNVGTIRTEIHILHPTTHRFAIIYILVSAALGYNRWYCFCDHAILFITIFF